MKVAYDIEEFRNTDPSSQGEFVMTRANGYEAVWAYIPEGFEAVVYRKQPGSIGTRDVGFESKYPNHHTIGIKFVPKSPEPPCGPSESADGCAKPS